MNSGSLHFSFVSMVWKGGEGGHAGENGFVVQEEQDDFVVVYIYSCPYR